MARYQTLSRTEILLFSAVVFILIGIFGSAALRAENESIAKVENNLLPPVLIEGELPYNLLDRMASYHIPGLSIAVIKDFKIDWVKHYGVRDAELGDPVTDSTLFCVGSVSKAAAAATILHLVDQGRIHLEDNVNDYLKSWKVPENEFTRKAPVTIGRLMNHSGGMMYSPPHSYSPDNMPTLIQYLNAEPPLKIKPTVADYVPGTKFQYANAGFSALQIMAEDISGVDYATFARKVLFNPLGLTYSTFEQPISPEKALYAAAGHRSDGSVYDVKQPAYPSQTAGGLWTTAEEYAKFIIDIQRTLKGESHLIMSQELAREMTTPHEAREYGYGVFMRYTNEVTYFGHIGDAKGFIAGFVAHPTDGYGAVVTVNSGTAIPFLREVMAGIASVYDFQSLTPPTHPLYNLDPETKSAYSGRYRIGFDDVCVVSEREGHLHYQDAGISDMRLYAVSKDSLVAKERLGQLVFIADSTGAPARCLVQFADDIGRLPASETEGLRMAEGEMTAIELLLSGAVDEAATAYKNLQMDSPDDPAIAEERFNRLGYQLLGQKKVTEALAVFQLNIDLYPESGNCWDSRGEALYAAGNKEESLRHYQKALELDPLNTNAQKWIDKLLSES